MLASLNVMQCKMSHDKCRSTGNFKFDGQNLAVKKKSSAHGPIIETVERFIDGWYGEKTHAKHSDIEKPDKDKSYLHFLVLVADQVV